MVKTLRWIVLNALGTSMTIHLGVVHHEPSNFIKMPGLKFIPQLMLKVFTNPISLFLEK